MKQWRVDNYIIGPAVDAEYDNTADELAEVLNSYEKKGYKIQEIIEVREGFFRIIYTSEDSYEDAYEDENICASYRVRKVKTHLSDYEQGVYFGRYGIRKEYIENDEPYCMATRELESCNCDGDRSKCNFYMHMDKKDEKERD